MPGPRLYYREAAARAGVEPDTWRKYVRLGNAPKPRQDEAGRNYWTPAQVDQYLRGRTGQGYRTDQREPGAPTTPAGVAARVEDAIRAMVAAGQPGDRLLGELALAADLIAGRSTVRAVLAKLVGEGLVRAERGRGYFVV